MAALRLSRILLVAVLLLLACCADAKKSKSSSKKSKKTDQKHAENNTKEPQDPCGLPTLALIPGAVEWTVGQSGAEILVNVGYSGPTNGKVNDVHVTMKSSAPRNVVKISGTESYSTATDTYVLQSAATSKYGLTITHPLNLQLLKNPKGKHEAYPFTLTFVATAPKCVNNTNQVTRVGTYFIVPSITWPLVAQLSTPDKVKAGTKKNKVTITVENVSEKPVSNYTVTLGWTSVWNDLLVYASASPSADNFPSNPLRLFSKLPILAPHDKTTIEVTYNATYEGQLLWNLDVKPLVYPDVLLRQETHIEHGWRQAL